MARRLPGADPGDVKEIVCHRWGGPRSARDGPGCVHCPDADPRLNAPPSAPVLASHRHVFRRDVTDALYADGHTFAWISVSSTSQKHAQILSSFLLKDGTDDH